MRTNGGFYAGLDAARSAGSNPFSISALSAADMRPNATIDQNFAAIVGVVVDFVAGVLDVVSLGLTK